MRMFGILNLNLLGLGTEIFESFEGKFGESLKEISGKNPSRKLEKKLRKKSPEKKPTNCRGNPTINSLKKKIGNL
jgi:hypothetical protein